MGCDYSWGSAICREILLSPSGLLSFLCSSRGTAKDWGADLESCPRESQYLFPSICHGKWIDRHLATTLIPCLLWNWNTLAHSRKFCLFLYPHHPFPCPRPAWLLQRIWPGTGCWCQQLSRTKSCLGFCWCKSRGWAQGDGSGSLVCSSPARREIYLIILHHQVATWSRGCRTPLEPGLPHHLHRFGYGVILASAGK